MLFVAEYDQHNVVMVQKLVSNTVLVVSIKFQTSQFTRTLFVTDSVLRLKKEFFVKYCYFVSAFALELFVSFYNGFKTSERTSMV